MNTLLILSIKNINNKFDYSLVGICYSGECFRMNSLDYCYKKYKHKNINIESYDSVEESEIELNKKEKNIGIYIIILEKLNIIKIINLEKEISYIYSSTNIITVIDTIICVKCDNLLLLQKQLLNNDDIDIQKDIDIKKDACVNVDVVKMFDSKSEDKIKNIVIQNINKQSELDTSFLLDIKKHVEKGNVVLKITKQNIYGFITGNIFNKKELYDYDNSFYYESQKNIIIVDEKIDKSNMYFILAVSGVSKADKPLEIENNINIIPFYKLYNIVTNYDSEFQEHVNDGKVIMIFTFEKAQKMLSLDIENIKQMSQHDHNEYFMNESHKNIKIIDKKMDTTNIYVICPLIIKRFDIKEPLHYNIFINLLFIIRKKINELIESIVEQIDDIIDVDLYLKENHNKLVIMMQCIALLYSKQMDELNKLKICKKIIEKKKMGTAEEIHKYFSSISSLCQEKYNITALRDIPIMMILK